MGTSALATLGLLMSLYLHKPGLCQDPRASKAGPWYTRQKMLLAQRTRVWRAGGGVALCWRDGQIPRASRSEQRGQSPLLCQELSPLPRQRLEEQDEAAQEVQTRGSGISGSALPGALGCRGEVGAVWCLILRLFSPNSNTSSLSKDIPQECPRRRRCHRGVCGSSQELPGLGAAVDLGQEGYTGRLETSAAAMGMGTSGWPGRGQPRCSREQHEVQRVILVSSEARTSENEK